MNYKKDVIPGYVHPTSTNTTRDSKYKTFTEGKKYKKKEEFGTTTAGANYATISTETVIEKCPTCSELVETTCPCAYSDKKCKNSHIWYTDREGKTKTGNPH